MFGGFAVHDVDAAGVRIHARVGGKGPPVLLLHGYPQTHVTWGPVAEALAQSHTVVAADLRGYGDSDKPASETDHSSYGKRVMFAMYWRTTVGGAPPQLPAKQVPDQKWPPRR